MSRINAAALWPMAAERTSENVAFTARVATTWEAARPEWEAAFRAGTATPFQHGAVVDAWYRAMAGRPGIEPLIVTLRSRETGNHALSLALIRTTFGGRRTIGFADLGLIDYNAPILGPAAPRTREAAAGLWRALLAALPKADLIDLRKMPAEIAGRPNPFALLGALPCPLNGNVVITDADWDTYRRNLKRTTRKELERSWRVFTRHPQAAFRPVEDAAERAQVLAAIEAQQPLRMQATGRTYVLDAPDASAFYHNLIVAPDAPVALTALTAGDEIVAGLLGLRARDAYIMVRISNREGEWANASPGRVIIDKTMEWLHGQGHRSFDFSIGNYDYKRRFGVQSTALVDLVRPLSLRGLPVAAGAHARAWLARHPRLREGLRRVLGRG